MRERKRAMPRAAAREFDFDEQDFDRIAGLIKERVGIVLGPGKETMVYSRLSRRLRELGISSFKDYLALISSPKGSDEFYNFMNALTTNLTKFFRESHHFDHLEGFLNERSKAAKAGHPKRFRIWSAGCSSGEEPYSMAMVIDKWLENNRGWDAKILATDIDTNMVRKCKTGIYPAASLEKIPQAYKKRAFESKEVGEGQVRIKQNLRDLITFKSLNLLGPWPIKGPFDAIFCRNVGIYFDRPTQTRLFERYAELLADDGYVYIGHSENLFNVTKKLKLVGKTIYRKPD
ncbi:MAG: protein-glutamate O-methyltransferase [Magnetovibrionaceae bacterium]